MSSLRYAKKAPKRSPRTKEREKLPVKHTNSCWEVERSRDLLSAMDKIVSSQWKAIPQQLNTDFIEHIEKARKFVPPLVSTFQLYSITSNASFVDHQLHILGQQNVLRQLSTTAKFNLVMKLEDYVKLIDVKDSTLSKFREFVSATNFITISKNKLLQTFTDTEISALLNKNFLTLIPQDINTLGLSIPNMGFTIKLLQTSQLFFTRVLKSTQWKELSHDELDAKWAKNKALYKDFKGLTLDWPIHHLIGQGTVECFDTINKKAIRLL